MENLRISDLNTLSKASKIRLMLYFLMNLTIAFRDIINQEGGDVKRKLRGLNQVQHMILTYVTRMYENRKDSYTDEIISQNVIDIAECYDLKPQISFAWTLAVSALNSQVEPSDGCGST